MIKNPRSVSKQKGSTLKTILKKHGVEVDEPTDTGKLTFIPACKQKMQMQMSKDQSAVAGTSICVRSYQALPKKKSIDMRLSLGPQVPNHNLIVGIVALRQDGSFARLIGLNGANVPSLKLTLGDNSYSFEHQSQLPVHNVNIGKLALMQDKATSKDQDLQDLDEDDQLLLIEGIDRMTKEKSINYDELGKQLFRKLNLGDPKQEERKESEKVDKVDEEENRHEKLYSELLDEPSVVWVHPDTGAKFFIGGKSCAMNLQKLEQYEIFNIINAKGKKPETWFFFKDDPRFRYLHFHLQGCEERKATLKTSADVITFFEPMHMFIDQSLANGQNVMVHCNAGAHRGGTAGISYMMHAG